MLCCLLQVCSLLGIVETDYFGLTHQNGRNGDALWLNLRNRICQEVSGGQPYRLELRVKFFVPAHMIQQEVTRYNLLCSLFCVKTVSVQLSIFVHVNKCLTFAR